MYVKRISFFSISKTNRTFYYCNPSIPNGDAYAIHSFCITCTHANTDTYMKYIEQIVACLYLYFECPFNNINLWYYAITSIQIHSHYMRCQIFCRSGDNFILTTDIDTEIWAQTAAFTLLHLLYLMQNYPWRMRHSQLFKHSIDCTFSLLLHSLCPRLTFNSI